MGVKFANSAFATLASSINSSATSITLTTGQGARFPSLGAGDYFYATLIDTSNNLEIVKCTARSTDVLTVTRGQESTTARAYSAGDRIELRITAQSIVDVVNTLVETGVLAVPGTSSSPAILRLAEDTDNGTNYIGLKAPASVGSNLEFTLPSTDGSNGQLLKTNGSGVLSFGAGSGQEIFTSSGTFTVPSGVTTVYVTGCGGGGGGLDSWGSGGGAGAWCMKVPVTVTPGGTISVTVGSGGSVNNNGGASSFGSHITLGGGATGNGGGNTESSYALGGSLSFGSGVSGLGANGQGGKFSNHASAGHGEAGSTPFGQTGRNSNTSSSTNDTKGYGAGGHSGWGSSYTATGNPGFILVEW
jgi:hypothetical protein